MSPLTDAGGALGVLRPGGVFTVSVAMMRSHLARSSLAPRDHHRAVLADTVIHRRFGVQNENIFRALAHTATGVAPLLPRALQRFVTGASSRASTHRTSVRRESVPSTPPEPSRAASVDLTHQFLPDVDGFVCAAIFMDLRTWNIYLARPDA